MGAPDGPPSVGDDEGDSVDRQTPDSATVRVRNVGGIDDCELTLSSGVTVLTGRNATGRTSLLSALAGALGGSSARLKTDTRQGSVELELGEATYRRTYTRTDEGVAVDGSPLTDEGDLVDLFACLLESNPARRAVERGDDLRPLIMAPIDTGEIESAIEDCESELDRVADRLDEIERKVERRPALQERAEELHAELADLDDDLDRARAAVENGDDAGLAEDAQELLDALDTHRDQRGRLVEKRRTQRQSIDALESEREELQAEIDATTLPDEELGSVESAIEELQARERSLARTIEELTTIVAFNDDLLSGSVPASLSGTDDAALAAESEDDLRCWTCGNAVEETALSERLAELRTVIERKREEHRTVEERLDSLRERRQRLTERQREYEELRDRHETVTAELSRRRKRVETIEDQLDAVDEEIAELEAEIEETTVGRDGDALDHQQELTELEYRRGRLDGELQDVEAEIDRLDDLDAERDDLRERRAALETEREELRCRIVDKERTAVETFNDHVADVLALLDYGNIERVWIERTAEDDESASSFDLHIVRAGPDGRYEDSVDTLSESEREVIGLLVALPGYLVHDVSETVPFVLLDSLEAIDADRIAALVDYFAEHAPYLVVALLPEDAAALDEEYDRIPAGEIGA